MSYRNLLLERHHRDEEQLAEPRAIDYLEHRNREALRAWRERQFRHSAGLHGTRERPARDARA